MPRVTIASTGGSVDVGWTSAQTDRALRAALAELTGLPAAESILLRDADDYFLFDRRLLRADAPCPAPPSARGPLPPPITNGLRPQARPGCPERMRALLDQQHTLLLSAERAETLAASAERRLNAARTLLQNQRGALRALAAALGNVRAVVRDHEAPVEAAGLVAPWRALAARAEAPPPPSAAGELGPSDDAAAAAALRTAEAVHASQASRRAALHEAQRALHERLQAEAVASQAEGVGEGGGTALELPPLDVAQTMADMEAGEAQLLDAEASLARRSEVVGLHVHGRLQVLASLQAELQTLHQQATMAPGAAASHEDLGAGLTLRRLSIGGASGGEAAGGGGDAGGASDSGFGEALRKGTVVGRYSLVECIGRGSFATVYRAEPADGGGPSIAVKAIDRARLSEKSVQLLSAEVRIMRSLHHPHVVQMLDAAASAGHVLLFLQLCSSDLSRLIRAKPRPVAPDEAEAAALFSQLASALAYLRARSLLHRDLKPHNLLLDGAAGAPPRLLIGDFGLARALEPSAMAETMCGSPLYMAPEVLRRLPYDERAEMWSVGCCLYELLCGTPPYAGATVAQLLAAVDGGAARPPLPPALSASCAALLSGLLTIEASQRLGFAAFVAHPFLAAAPPPPPPPAAPPTEVRGGSSPAASMAASSAAGGGELSAFELLKDDGDGSGSAGGGSLGGSSSMLLEWLELGGGAAMHACRAALAAEVAALESELESERLGRRLLRRSLEQLVKQLPDASTSATSTANGLAASAGGAASGTLAAPPNGAAAEEVAAIAAAAGVAAEAAPQLAAEAQLARAATAGAALAQRLFRERAKECKRLRDAMRSASPKPPAPPEPTPAAAADSAAEPLAAPRPTAASASTASVAEPAAAAAGAASLSALGDGISLAARGEPQPSELLLFVRAAGGDPRCRPHVAVRHGGGAPLLLARVSQEVLARRLGRAVSALPELAAGRVVYTEGPLRADASTAAELGLRVGDEYAVVTCEMVELDDPREMLRG